MLSKIGVRTVDVGMTILSMHSCRETVRPMLSVVIAGAFDLTLLRK